MIKDIIEKNSEIKANTKELEVLKKHFPSCFDKDGKFDIKIFEELIKTEEVDIKKEGYTLNFLGKSYARYLASLDSETVIVPDAENKNTNSENIYIVGDNLDALQHLKYSYSQKIKCIYIDPPYNTGSDGFVYNDKFEFTAEELARKINIEEDEAQRILDMQGKSTHSAWLAFMYPRLELARELLSDDGIIFISIDDNELANLKLLCDSIFSEANFIGEISVVSNPRGRDYGGIARMNDYLLVYQNSDKCEISLIDDENGGFTLFDSLGGFETRELRNRNIKFNKENRPNLYYPFYININNIDEHGLYEINLEKSDNTIELYPLESQGINTVWRWGKEKSKENLNINIKAKKMKNGGFQIVEKYREARKMARSVWWDKDTNTEKGTLLVKELFNAKVFDYPKTIEMIDKVFQMSTNEYGNNIVLDFFSGSASTAHAVMQHNIDKEKNLKYIIVQMAEEVAKDSIAVKEGYKTIDEIGRERIRRAAEKIRKEKPEKSKNVDLGFKTYYLKTTEKNTLDKIRTFDPNMPIEAEDIKSKFGVDTILETWKIKDGFGFNGVVEKIDLAGYVAYKLFDSKVGTYLYLLEDMPDSAIVELVRKIEAFELNVDKIIEYGYAFSFNSNSSLRSNLKTLKNRNAIDPLIRY